MGRLEVVKAQDFMGDLMEDCMDKKLALLAIRLLASVSGRQAD